MAIGHTVIAEACLTYRAFSTPLSLGLDQGIPLRAWDIPPVRPGCRTAIVTLLTVIT